MKAPYNELCTVCKGVITAGKHDIVEHQYITKRIELFESP